MISDHNSREFKQALDAYITKEPDYVEEEFAPEYSRDDKGWILFPSDVNARAEVFPQEVNSHPAKANLHLVQAIIEYVSSESETVMDIMGGSGTVLIGALMNRRVICIEISEKFHKLQQMAVDNIERIAPGAGSQIVLINAPCQSVLPIPADHIIFSPPYAQIMKSKGTDKLTMEKTDYNMAEYSQDPLNVGQVSEFYYRHMMEGIYKKCWQSLPAGGTLTIIIKNHIYNGKEIMLSERAEKDCERIGFELSDWFRWPTLGSVYTRIYRSQGKLTVDSENIIILRK